MYDKDGELTGDGRRLVDEVDAASEKLRCACHLLTWMDTAELDPSDWSRLVATMHELTGRLDQVLGHLSKRYDGLDGAYPGGLAADDGTSGPDVASVISLLLGSARDKVEPLTAQLVAAHNRAARLLTPEVTA